MGRRLVCEMSEMPGGGCATCTLRGTPAADRLAAGGYTESTIPPSPLLHLVGEAPGPDEADGQTRNGEGALVSTPPAPFLGAAGRVLRATLRRPPLALEESEYALSNVVRCKPRQERSAGGGPGKFAQPTPAEQAACSPLLEEDMRRSQARVVVALGRVAADRFLGVDQTAALLKARSGWDGYVWRPPVDPLQVGAGGGMGPVLGVAPASAFLGVRLVPHPDGRLSKTGKRKGQVMLVKEAVRLRAPWPPSAVALVTCLHPSAVQLSGFALHPAMRMALQVAKAVAEGHPVWPGPATVFGRPEEWWAAEKLADV